MLIGLFFTLSAKVPGTLLILIGAAVYGIYTDFITFLPWEIYLLLFISAVSELGGRILRITLTDNCALSRSFSINSIVCHLGGMLACTALLGSLSGFVLWQLVAGKTLVPRNNTIVQVLLRLAAVAGVRFICGCIMIIIIHLYIFM
ncbi:MAG: hypothetical protein H6Q72_45 [Firmicutes bacterium]|nr:hypothetical protein [Bacillota bacterium]